MELDHSESHSMEILGFRNAPSLNGFSQGDKARRQARNR